MRSRWIVPLMAAPLLLPSVAAHAQRDMYGMTGNRPQDQRRQFEAEARQQVSSFMTDYESAWGSRDVRALTALYARDGVLYPPGGGAWRGRDSLAIYFVRVLPSVLPMRSRISEFRMGSDLAYVTLETVRQSSLGADSLLETTGRDALVMRRDAFGDWRIVWHLVRPETIVRRAIPREPPPQPAAATPAPPRAKESAGVPAEEAR